MSSAKATPHAGPEDPWRLDDLAGALSGAGQYDEAIKLGRRAVELEPASAMLRHNLSIDCSYIGTYDAAESECRRNLEIEPNEPYSMLLLGRNRPRRVLGICRCEAGDIAHTIHAFVLPFSSSKTIFPETVRSTRHRRLGTASDFALLDDVEANREKPARNEIEAILREVSYALQCLKIASRMSELWSENRRQNDT